MTTKKAVAEAVAQEHYLLDATIEAIYRVTAENEDAPGEPLKLLEVSGDTVPIGIKPLHFGSHPASGLYYPLTLTVITPDEFSYLRLGELHLPEGWSLDALIENRSAPEQVAA